MKIWKNTSTLNGYDDGLIFSELKTDADIALIGSKPINVNEMPKLKGIFRAGIGRDNVPEKEANDKGIIVRYPSNTTMDIIYNETARFTCGLILRMLYGRVGTLEPWIKNARHQLTQKILLVVGTGNIGNLVVQLMKPFMKIITFDILKNETSELKELFQKANCITIHIPKSNDNISFIDGEKLSWMKNGAILINTSRGEIVDEYALYKEIKNDRLRAAFDVYWNEPYKGKLIEFYPDNFYMTPHVASTCCEFLLGCRKGLDKLIKDLS